MTINSVHRSIDQSSAAALEDGTRVDVAQRLSLEGNSVVPLKANRDTTGGDSIDFSKHVLFKVGEIKADEKPAQPPVDQSTAAQKPPAERDAATDKPQQKLEQKPQEKGVEAVDPAQKLLLERAEKEHQLVLKHTENELKLKLEYFQKEKNSEGDKLEILGKLTDLCQSQKRIPEALKYCNQALEIADKSNYFRGSRTAADLTFKSGELYLQSDKLDDATKAFGKAAILYDQPGALQDWKDANKLRRAYECYSNCLQQQDTPESKAKALDIDQRYGEIRSAMDRGEKKMTPLLQGIEQRIEAMLRGDVKPDLKELDKEYNKRLEVVRATEGDKDLRVYESLARLGMFAYADERPADGKRYFSQMLDLAEKNYGKDSPAVGYVVDSIARSHDLVGNLQESAANYKRAIEIFEKSDHKTNVEIQNYASSALKGYAEVLTKLKDTKGAEQALERAKKIDAELKAAELKDKTRKPN